MASTGKFRIPVGPPGKEEMAEFALDAQAIQRVTDLMKRTKLRFGSIEELQAFVDRRLIPTEMQAALGAVAAQIAAARNPSRPAPFRLQIV